MNDSPNTVYDAIGGADTLRRLVDIFYDNVANNTTLRPLFPEDFSDIKERQYWFLTQFFGGPALYAENRGAPKLRMRHLPFPIGPKHAKAWLACMENALVKCIESDALRQFMLERFTLTANHMVNQPKEAETP